MSFVNTDGNVANFGNFVQLTLWNNFNEDPFWL